jgi:hypothetical protein
MQEDILRIWAEHFLDGFLSGNTRKAGILPGELTIVNPVFQLFKRKSKLKVEYRKTKNDYEYNKQKAMKQQHIDDILDKISKSGYESLTREEKEILFKVSKKP